MQLAPKKLLLIFFVFASNCLFAQKENLPKTSAGFPINYEEELTGNYTLPALFTLKNGTKVSDAKTWTERRRPEIIRLFEEHQFGKVPPRPKDMRFKVFDKGTPAFNGKALRKQVIVYFTKDTTGHKMDLLIYLPARADKASPLLLIANFSANVNAVDDPGVKAGFVWTREGKKVPASEQRAFGKIDVAGFVSQGFGVATVCYTDIEPDFKQGLKYGIRSTYLKPGQTEPAPNEWGAISAWSWGLSRAMDYFATDSGIDANRVALQGTSRLGKTVLWTGARDPRFKMVIASCSGEGGAAISRRDYGENIKHMTDTSRYYYQFAPNWHSYAANFNASPVDAHMLVALMAPRPLLLQTGDTDYWSDPKGEFLAAVAAEPVYKLFGKGGPSGDMPGAGDQSLLRNTLAYYMHAGGHGTIPADWPLFIDYMKRFL
ncbi:acetylxylan esterase [Segetibacter sp. 3557_3]|uniref:alpha/beta hydrolase family protein n=1 Tax=Segetibacter sp. 3557_3 TaxID=2547429 RepID=UPI001058E435|nr:acetylxylan esterase [Segetibacter sp. 3557_3]TDH21665.1 acetylxylan esterase [Segetibacter sp. 3557_3]